MDKKQLTKQFKAAFPAFDQSDLVEQIIEHSQYLEIPAGLTILNRNDYIKVIPLVIEGTIKVSRINEKDKAVFLYHIRSGETCAMTLSSCLKMERSKVTATSIQDSKIIALPITKVYDFNKQFPSWQHFTINTFTNRFGDFLSLIEDFSFNHIVNRLNNHLTSLQQIHNSNILTISHRQLARDLATSREVISRILKQLERQQLLSLHRGKIKLLPLFFKKNT